MDKDIDYFIKIGGSLIENESKFNDLNKKIISRGKKTTIIITTGSKNLSDVMMDYIQNVVKFELNETTRFDLVMKARDSMSKIFSDTKEEYLSVESNDELQEALKNGYIPVIAQYKMLKEDSPFKFGKGLSTDTISAHFAKKFNAGKFIKLTNVDGVFKDFGTLNQELINEIHASELLKMGTTCIDERFAQYLLKEKISCNVLNGYNLSNLEKFLNGKESIFTRVYS